VISRKRNADGNTVGWAHDWPILDTRTYDVEFNDGTIAKLRANKIAECMYAQCDPRGNQYVLLDCFVDFDKSLTAISLADQNIVMKGHPSKRRNTYGWKICCQWKDGSMTWESLKDLKESHPLEMAEYAITQGIDHEPAFNWWVPQVLRLRKRIISLVKKRKMSYLKKNLSICYHAVREAVLMGEILTSHVRTENNFSGFMTKVTYGRKRRHLVGSVLFDIYDDHSNKKSRLTENPAE
jgi:hypothetical protein